MEWQIWRRLILLCAFLFQLNHEIRHWEPEQSEENRALYRIHSCFFFPANVWIIREGTCDCVLDRIGHPRAYSLDDDLVATKTGWEALVRVVLLCGR